MKMKEMLSTPIGHFASASLQNHPELQADTPRNTQLLVEFAQINGLTIEGVICALVNWMGVNCDDIRAQEELQEDLENVKPPDYIN
jgi:hypothetical protein